MIGAAQPTIYRAARDLEANLGTALFAKAQTGIAQETLFHDRLGVFCGPKHPLRRQSNIVPTDMASYPWVVPRTGTPTRSFFDSAMFPAQGDMIEPLVETSSMILVRDLLQTGNRLTLISRAQVATELRLGLLCELPIDLLDPPRPIGITTRAGWYPTREQAHFLDALRGVADREPASMGSV